MYHSSSSRSLRLLLCLTLSFLLSLPVCHCEDITASVDFTVDGKSAGELIVSFLKSQPLYSLFATEVQRSGLSTYLDTNTSTRNMDEYTLVIPRNDKFIIVEQGWKDETNPLRILEAIKHYIIPKATLTIEKVNKELKDKHPSAKKGLKTLGGSTLNVSRHDWELSMLKINNHYTIQKEYILKKISFWQLNGVLEDGGISGARGIEQSLEMVLAFALLVTFLNAAGGVA